MSKRETGQITLALSADDNAVDSIIKTTLWWDTQRRVRSYLDHARDVQFTDDWFRRRRFLSSTRIVRIAEGFVAW